MYIVEKNEYHLKEHNSNQEYLNLLCCMYIFLC